jgi:hypothetical protein
VAPTEAPGSGTHAAGGIKGFLRPKISLSGGSSQGKTIFDLLTPMENAIAFIRSESIRPNSPLSNETNALGSSTPNKPGYCKNGTGPKAQHNCNAKAERK